MRSLHVVCVGLAVLAACVPPPPTAWRVGTFNARTARWQDAYGAWALRRDAAVRALDDLQLDALALQELAPAPSDQAAALTAPAEDDESGGGAVRAVLFEGADGEDSQAIRLAAPLAHTILSTGTALIAPGHHAVYVVTEALTIIGVHADGSTTAVAAVAALSARLPHPQVVLGDFNAFDAPNPYLPDASGPLAAAGLKSAFAAPHVVRPTTCWEQCMTPPIDARVDWVFSDLEATTADIDVAWAAPGLPISDHFPTHATLRIP